MPWVISSTRSFRSSFNGLITSSAPSFFATAARAGSGSERMTFAPPARLRMAMAASPTGPEPQITTLSPGLMPPPADDHARVGDAARLHHAAQPEDIRFADSVRRSGSRLHTGSVRDDEVLGEPAVDVEPDLIEPLAVVGIPVGAGLAGAAPEHLLRAHPLPALEGLVRHLVLCAGARVPHDPRKLVAEGAGKPGEPGIEDVAVVVGLRHVHVAAADAALPDLDQDLFRAPAWGSARPRLRASGCARRGFPGRSASCRCPSRRA